MINQDEQNLILDRRTKGFSHIENRISRDFGPAIGAYGVAVYVLLCSYAGVKKQAWPSKRTMAECLHVAISTIDKALWTLNRAELIQIRSRKRADGGKSSNAYILIDPPETVPAEYLFPHKRKDKSGRTDRRGHPHCGGGGDNRNADVGITATRLSENESDRKKIQSAENPADGAQILPEKTADKKPVNGRKKDFKPTGSFQGEPPRNNPQDSLSPGGFFQDSPCVSAKPTYPDLAAARLWDIAVKNNMDDKRSSRIKWSEIIRKYIVSCKMEFDEFEIELAWYEQHYDDDYCPQAFSASTFCRKFLDIRLARHRDAKRNGEMTAEERQENIAIHNGYDPLADTPIQIMRPEDMSPDMQMWSDFNRKYSGHDLSLVQFTKMRKHHSEMTFKELDDFCIKMTPPELWAYADALPG